MIIADDSPLRLLPSKMNHKQVLFFDGILYSIEMADLAYSRLIKTLQDIAINRNDFRNKQPEFVSAFLDAWSVIDSIYRLRGLLTQAPGVKKRSPGLRVFLNHTTETEALRHSVQHLNTQINAMVDENLPVWGVLSWFTMLDAQCQSGLSCLLLSGTLFSSKHLFVNPLGRKLTLPIDLITLTASGHTVCLSEAMTHVEQLARSIELSLKKQFPNSPHAGRDLLICLEIEFDDSSSSESK